MAQPEAGGPAIGMPMESPDVGTVRALLHAVRVLAVLICGLILLAGLVNVIVALVTFQFGFPGFVIGGIALVLNALIFLQAAEIRSLVNIGNYRLAKERTILWMILGFFPPFINGFLLLLVYLKLDTMTQASAGTGQGVAPAWGPPAGAAAPGAPAGAPGQLTCPRCGQPAHWIAQYGRWYCYHDQQYI